MTTPVHEFLGLTKEALSPNVKSAITMGAIAAGTTAITAIGTAQLQAGIESAHDAVSRSIAFKKMMRDNPQLNKMDGKQARRYFNTLYNTAPELGKDPFASGSWVTKMREYDYVDPQSLSTLATTGSKLRERRREINDRAFGLAQVGVTTGMNQYSELEQQDAARKAERNKAILDYGFKGIGALGKMIGDERNRQVSYATEQEKLRAVHGLNREKREFEAWKMEQQRREKLQDRFEDQQFSQKIQSREEDKKEWEMLSGPGKIPGVSPSEYRNQYRINSRRQRMGQPPIPGFALPMPRSGGMSPPQPRTVDYSNAPKMSDPPSRPIPRSSFGQMVDALRDRFGKP